MKGDNSIYDEKDSQDSSEVENQNDEQI